MSIVDDRRIDTVKTATVMKGQQAIGTTLSPDGHSGDLA
jgi:hypothetical protein